MATDWGLGEIWWVSVKSGELKRLTRNLGGFLYDPVYSLSGEEIYYTSTSGPSWALWKLPLSPTSGEATGEPVEIKNTGAVLFKHLKVSTDGKKIAYSALSMVDNIWAVPVSPKTGLATGPPTPLTQDTLFRKSSPSYSPDGKRLAFGVSRVGARDSVWLMDADGRNSTELTSGSGYGGSQILGWPPQGNQIAFLVNRSGRRMLCTVSADSRRETCSGEFPQDAGFSRLSPDGKQIAFNSRKSGTINIWTASLGGGPPRQLTFDRELMGWPYWSPDGKFLGLEIQRGDDTHVGVMSSDGGPVTQLTFDHGQSWTASWSPDGDKIAFAGLRNGVWNIWWVSRRDRTEKQLTNYTKLNTYARYPDWSPSGDHIAYEYAETSGNIWVELK